MNLRWLVFLALAGTILFSACTNKETRVTFKNEADCGTATVTLQHSQTGNERVYMVEQDKSVEITIDNGIAYHYEITYERLPGAIQCDSKSGTILLPNRGDNVSFALESATPTPEAGTASSG